MVRLGTCSWKFPSWSGLVYSAPDPPSFLSEYARSYPTVEIDQWFWSLFGPDSVKLPDPRTVAEYAAAVDPGFRFTVKAPNAVTLTHIYRKARRHAGESNPYYLSPELFGRFLQRLEPLQGQLDFIILQFEYLNRTKVASASSFLEDLGTFLSTIPDGWPIAVETRNPNFLTGAWFEMLAHHGVSHVFNEGYYMPPVWEIYHRHREALVPRSVIRLLGPDRGRIEEQTGKRWDRRLAPKDEGLRHIAAMTNEMLSRGFEVTINVNNHYEGSAPRTIEALRPLLNIP